MTSSKTIPCGCCKQTISWEMLGGMRLYRTDKNGTKYYQTQCGCGLVPRDSDGNVEEIA